VVESALPLVFSGTPGSSYAPMMAGFICFTPLFVGAISVYVAERTLRRSWWYYVWVPFVANLLYVLGLLVVMIEGLVCVIVIAPLFAAVGSVGGLIMGVVCRITNWPRQAIYGLGALPLLLGALETNLPLPERMNAIERSVLIRAAPETVWRQIHNARAIQPEEVGRAWAYRIGVPMPLAGVTQQTPAGPVRRITMGKGVHFDQVFAEWRENRYLRWTYRFYEDSFPPNALDEHVVIGGHYFDIKEGSYVLTPRGELTELKIRMQYRVSTQFNWYANAWAQGLLGNFGEVILDFYRHRSESTPQGK
jgi:hypothetical protein